MESGLFRSWYVLAWSTEVGQNILARTALNVPLVLFRDKDGFPVVMDDLCPHRLVPLSHGRIVEGTLQCGYHGLRYDATGHCIYVPGQQHLPPGAVVRTFPAVERHRWIWVWLGNPADADPECIPDFHWMEDPAWVASGSSLHIKANFRLLNDNLLDLTHETFVHSTSIGTRAVAESPLHVQVTDDKAGTAVRAHREMLGCETPPAWRSVLPVPRIDRWHTTIYRPPSFLVIETGGVPVGSRDPEERYETRVMNAITPETNTSSHYFFANAIIRHKANPTPEWFAQREQSMLAVFSEDKLLLEAQQAAIAQRGLEADRFPLSLKADAGGTQGRRLLTQWLRGANRREELSAR